MACACKFINPNLQFQLTYLSQNRILSLMYTSQIKIIIFIFDTNLLIYLSCSQLKEKSLKIQCLFVEALIKYSRK